MEKSNLAYNRKMTMRNTMHQPVLLNEVFDLLNIGKQDVYLDLTAGFGGHAKEAFKRVSSLQQLILVDRDIEAVNYLQPRFNGARIIHSDFLNAIRQLLNTGTKVDAVLMDLGVSSVQLDSAGRGFSFRYDAPLDMRMDVSQKLTAADIVNNFSEPEIADILYRYGEERRSRQIAKAIVESRPHRTTFDLLKVIEKVNYRRGRINPATRSFQALRIAVNDELRQLEETLKLIPEVLRPGGRWAVISFHSLEDRIVKHFFKECAQSHDFRLLSKKVIIAQKNELSNRRARSAKLRAVIKSKN